MPTFYKALCFMCYLDPQYFHYTDEDIKANFPLVTEVGRR